MAESNQNLPEQNPEIISNQQGSSNQNPGHGRDEDKNPTAADPLASSNDKGDSDTADFYELEQIFDRLYNVKPENKSYFHEEIAFHYIEREYEVPIDKVRNLYRIYCSYRDQQTSQSLKKVASSVSGIYHRSSQRAWTVVSRIAATTAIFGTIIGFLFTLQQFNNQFVRNNELQKQQNEIERENTIKDAWKALADNLGKEANYGRSGALELLASEGISLDGTNVSKANLNLLDLSPENLADLRNQKQVENTFFGYFKKVGRRFGIEINNDKESEENEDLPLYASLERTKFQGTQLQSSSLRGAGLIGADFSQVEDGAQQTLVNAGRTDFTNADLSWANLANAKLNGAILTFANLSNTDLSGTSFDGANIAHANLKGFEERTVDLDNFLESIRKITNWQTAVYSPTVRMQNSLCGQIFLSVLKLEESSENSSSSKPEKTERVLGHLPGNHFNEEDLKNFIKDYKTGFKFDMRCYSFAEFPKNNLLRRIPLSEITFEKSKLGKIDLSGLKFHKIDFSNSDLVSSDLKNGTFDKVNLNGANLTRADLSGSIFLDVNFGNANVHYAVFSGIKGPPQVMDKFFLDLVGKYPYRETKSWKYAVYDPTQRKREELCGKVFFLLQVPEESSSDELKSPETAGKPRLSVLGYKPVEHFNLNQFNTYLASLRAKNLGELDLSCLSFEKFGGTEFFADKDLHNSNLEDANFTRVNFGNSDLRNSSLEGTNFLYSNFSEIELQKIDLAELTKSKNFQFSIYNKTLRSQQELCGKVFFLVRENSEPNSRVLGHQPGKSFNKNQFQAFVENITLQDIDDLSCYSFFEFSKESGNQYFSNLDLSQQNLSRSNFQRVNFGNANLTDADLTNADIKCADLSNVRGLTSSQVIKAKNYEQAIYSEEFLEALNAQTGKNLSIDNATCN